MTTPARPRRSQFRLTVARTERLTPHFARIHFTGAPADVYGNTGATDSYMKLYFSTNGQPVPLPVDLAAIREEQGPDALPVQRTYSIRSYHTATETMAIDFVIHGDEGVAGPWAAAAQPGDEIVATSPGGAYAPAADADAHLLVGDESALPAIAAALEAMPDGAGGVALIEVDTAEDEIALDNPAGLDIRWLHRNGAGAGTTTLLVDAVATLDWPGEDVHVFAHGERETMKQIRAITKERGVPRTRLSLSGYWAYGRTEDRFQAEKREPIGQID